jgi:hypothetical protein
MYIHINMYMYVYIYTHIYVYIYTYIYKPTFSVFTLFFVNILKLHIMDIWNAYYSGGNKQIVQACLLERNLRPLYEDCS